MKNSKHQAPNSKQILNSKIQKSLLFVVLDLLFTRSVLVCFEFVILNFGFLADTAHAQSVGLSVSPPVVEILLAPNKQVKQTFTLQVEGKDVSIIPSLHLVRPVGNAGQSEINLEPLSPSSIPLTITSSPPLNQPLTINHEPLTITLALEAATLDIAQDVYLALVFRASPSTINHQPSTITTPSISALLLTTINPTGVMPINLEIQNFDPPLLHDSWLPFTLNPELKNSVDQMIRPEGKYEIISPTSQVIFSLPLYPNLILGKSSRSLQSTINHQPSTISYSPRWSQLGPHKVRLSITTQGGTKLTEVEKIVWFLPIRITMFVAIFTIISLTVISKRSRFKTV